MYTPKQQEGQNLLDPNYIVGFVDGEGCFSVGCSRRPDIKSGYEIRAAFEIEMVVDDQPILEKIHETLGRPGHQKKHLEIKYAKRIVAMKNKMNPTGKGNRKYNLVRWGSRSAGNPLATPKHKKLGPDRYA